MIEHCRLIPHDSGIYELIMLSGTKMAVDCYIDKIGALYQEMPINNTLRYILNASEAPLPPLQYFINRSNQYQREHPSIGKGRLAILYKQDIFVAVVARIIRMLNTLYRGALVMEMFEIKDRENAIAWLLETS